MKYSQKSTKIIITSPKQKEALSQSFSHSKTPPGHHRWRTRPLGSRNGGGKKENSSLPNLQVFLYLNTFEHKIKIVISHNNITWVLGTLILFLILFLGSWNIFYAKRRVPFVARQFNIPLNTLDLIVIQSDLHQIVQIFLLRVHMINSDFPMFSEYFILQGDKSNMN